MKKFLCCVLTSVYIFSVCGCSSDNNKLQETTVAETTAIATTIEPTTEEPTTAVPTTIQPTTEKLTEPLITVAPITESDKVVNELIYDSNDVKVYYIGKEIEDDGTQKFNLQIENNNDYDLTVTTMYVSANDYVIDPICRVDVPTGKKAIEPIYFLSSTLKKNNIITVDKLDNA